jgi:methyl-accepting chemotaxis protein
MGFNKSKQLDKKGESLIGRIGELANKAETIADADTGGGETARLRKMLSKVTDELDKALDELEAALKSRAIMQSAFEEAKEEIKKTKTLAAGVEKDAVRLKKMIKKYGELESGLGKAVEKVLDDMQKINDIEIEIPKDDFFE